MSKEQDLEGFEQVIGRAWNGSFAERIWHDCLAWERERVKREEPTFSEVLAALRSEEAREAHVIRDDKPFGVDRFPSRVVANWLEEHFKTTPRPEPRLQDDEQCCKICPKCIAIVLKK